MSLLVNLAVLAEGVAPDSRGLLTLVAANPQAFVADQFPAQFAPVFVIAIDEEKDTDTSGIIAAAQKITFRVQATDPDGNVVFYAQQQPPVPPAPHPHMPPRLNLVVQVPFNAPKVGEYAISARITVSGQERHDEVIEASQKVLVVDSAAMRSEVM